MMKRSSHSTIRQIPRRSRIESTWLLMGCLVILATDFLPTSKAFFTSPLTITRQQQHQHQQSMTSSRLFDAPEGEDNPTDSMSSSKRKSLPELLVPNNTCKVNQMSGTDLAYIGDAVFELFIRSRHVWPSRRTSELQTTVVSIVRAEHQSQLLAKLKQDFELSDKETQILMRGRNAVTRSKNRRNPAAYQDSTSFEALVGYLYIEDQERCCDLLNWLETVVDKVE